MADRPVFGKSSFGRSKSAGYGCALLLANFAQSNQNYLKKYIYFRKTAMWYYNKESGDCESFLWRGAGGNNNRFVTYDMCATVCLNDAENEVDIFSSILKNLKNFRKSTMKTKKLIFLRALDEPISLFKAISAVKARLNRRAVSPIVSSNKLCLPVIL